jgi:hypothetical protein
VALQRVQHGALRGGVPVGLRVVERHTQGPNVGVRRAAPQSDDSRADGRAHRVQRQDLGNPVSFVDPVQAGHRRHDRVEMALVQAHEASIDVAPQRFDLNVRVVQA